MKDIFPYIRKNYRNFDGNEIITSVDFARQCANTIQKINGEINFRSQRYKGNVHDKDVEIYMARKIRN